MLRISLHLIFGGNVSFVGALEPILIILLSTSIKSPNRAEFSGLRAALGK